MRLDASADIPSFPWSGEIAAGKGVSANLQQRHPDGHRPTSHRGFASCNLRNHYAFGFSRRYSDGMDEGDQPGHFGSSPVPRDASKKTVEIVLTSLRRPAP